MTLLEHYAQERGESRAEGIELGRVEGIELGRIEGIKLGRAEERQRAEAAEAEVRRLKKQLEKLRTSE